MTAILDTLFGTAFSAAAAINGWGIFWIVFGSFVLQSVVFIVAASYIVFAIVLKRRDKTKWTRECSDPTDPNQLRMYNEGCAWAKANEARKTDHHIVNEGLNLYAEYYDLGFDRTVIMIAGRTEGLRYGYYFVKPYVESGFNVLTIDQRCHGLSDGKYNSLGFNEHRDLLAWCRYAHDELGAKSVYLHGICIGSACAMYAITSPDCPDYVVGMTGEGMFDQFFKSFVQHAKEKNKKLRIVLELSNLWFKHYNGHSMKEGPIDCIGRCRKPLLMLHSKKDFYSQPEFAQKLFDACPSDKKRLEWFENGAHSMLRITDTEHYDNTIKSFLKEYFDPDKT